MVDSDADSNVLARLRQGTARIAEGSKGIADTIPVYAQISNHSAGLVGESTVNFFRDAETFLRCELTADLFYEIDAPTIHYDVYNIESEALGAALVWDEMQIPSVDPHRALLSSTDAYESLSPVKMGTAGRMPYVLEINARLADMGLAPKVRFTGLFTLAANLLGLQQLILAIATDPDRVHRLMGFLACEVVAPWITCQREACGRDDTATGCDALASPPLLSVEMVDEFSLRYIKELENRVGGIRLAGLWGESCVSRPTQLLDIKRAGTPGTIQVLDPDVTALGPEFFRRYADRNDVGLVMGLDANLIGAGSVEQIAARARRFIEEAGKHGRFVLFMNDIPYETAVENVRAVVSVAREYQSDSSNTCYVRRPDDAIDRQWPVLTEVHRSVARMMVGKGG